MKAKKIILPIVIVVAILAILGGIFAALWFFTDVFNFLKPANEVFSSQLEKALNPEGAKITDYSDFLKDYKEMSNKSYKSKMNMSANLNVAELDQKTQDIINKSKISLESNCDMNNRNSQTKVGLYSNNSEVLTVDVVNNKDKVGIGCKDLSDKYLVVSMEDLIKYLKSNSSSVSADEIKALETISKNLSSGSSLNTYDLLYISDEDLKHFDERYGDILNTLISKDCYSSEKNVEVKVDGDKVKTTGYYLTLTGKDAYKFAEDLSKLLKDDDVLVRIATEKINMILESSGQSKVSEQFVKDYMDKAFTSLLGQIESIKDEDEGAVQIAIYSKNNKPVRLEVNTLENAKKNSGKESLISIEYGKNVTIFTMYNNGEAYISVKDEYNKKSDKERSGKLTVSASGMSIGTLDYEIVAKESESKLYLSLNIPLAEISGEIKIETRGNYKKEAVQINGNVNFKYKKDSIEVKFDGSVEYGDVSVPELTSSNSIDILKLNSTELQNELNTILKKASEVLPARLKLIGVDVKAEDIFKGTATTPTTVEAPAATTNVTVPATTTIPSTTTVPSTTLTQEQKEALQKLMETQKVTQ